jgi:hypothetical protein
VSDIRYLRALVGTEGEATLSEMMVVRHGLESYVSDTMLNAFSLPTKSDKVPTGSEWIHEIKYDGYQMMLIRDQERVHQTHFCQKIFYARPPCALPPTSILVTNWWIVPIT